MSAERGPQGVRVSLALKARILERGTFSPTARALILIGMAAMGDDMTALYPDIRYLLLQPLADDLADRLMAIMQNNQAVLRVCYPRSTPVARMIVPGVPSTGHRSEQVEDDEDFDPLESLGVEV